ncbi:peptidylprolyl isomerase PrsA [Bacillus sp. 165]|uniref:peptidylprolyl isomerase PrsA n=1 Tax=Bacillus sp. 165 TaxID=1529117 RepID=UPI001AD97BB4|nr:peptidylprolyl isomerase PrsA [Bacillus sp. 165]MBO9128734.1 peptidylprolyl isomerase PrsA [Bacillus sp. 165]
MKKAIIALAATSMLTLSACNSMQNSDPIVKTSAGNVTKEEFYEAMKDRGGQSVLKELVVAKVFAKKYKVTDKEVDKEFDSVKEQYGDQFEDALKQSGMDEKALKEQIRSNLAIKKAVEKTITDKELKENYKPEIQASHILVADEAKAKEIKARLDKGEDFAKLAKEFSEDTGSAENGGDLGFFGPGKMVAEFEAVAYKLKVGEISEPVKSQFGYHIIKLTDKKELEPFDKVKDDIKADLVEKKVNDQTYVNKLVDDELKKADIKVEDKDLKDTFKPSEETSE